MDYIYILIIFVYYIFVIYLHLHYLFFISEIDNNHAIRLDCDLFSVYVVIYVADERVWLQYIEKLHINLFHINGNDINVKKRF